MEVKDAMNALGATDIMYLGDSVYAGHDNYGIWLVTWNGLYNDPRNKIYLEAQTLEAFDFWREQIKKGKT